MNLESENTFTSGQLVVISSEESFKKSFLETAEDDEKVRMKDTLNDFF